MRVQERQKSTQVWSTLDILRYCIIMLIFKIVSKFLETYRLVRFVWLAFRQLEFCSLIVSKIFGSFRAMEFYWHAYGSCCFVKAFLKCYSGTNIYKS